MMNPSETPVTTEPKKMTGRTKLALWLMITPSALITVAIILGIIAGIMWPELDSNQGRYVDDTQLQLAAITTLAWILGAIGYTTWFPGLVAGIILLATRKPQRKPNAQN